MFARVTIQPVDHVTRNARRVAIITSRRGFLRAVPACVVVASYASQAKAAQPTETLVLRLLKLFASRSSAARIGKAYLADRPAEADIHRLSLLLAGTAEPYARLERMSEFGLRRFVSARQQRDFQMGFVVNVDGWVITQTEARLCAIAWLTACQ